MDANTTYDPDQLAQHNHLPFQPGQSTVSPSHIGKLATLVSTCQLCLPLALQHETHPFPTLHISGQNQIDYILVSKSILPAILRSGVLPHLSLTRGDHRPYYLDFDAYKLFSDPAYQIDPPNIRQLQLKDPHKVYKYISNLHDLLGQQNVLTRLENLQLKLDDQQWTAKCIVEYESIRITTTYQWSPTSK